MKTVSVRKAKDNLSAVVKASRRETVVVLSRGVPAAVIIGVGGLDVSDLVMAELQRRRLSRDVVSSDEMSEALNLDRTEEKRWARRARKMMSQNQPAAPRKLRA